MAIHQFCTEDAAQYGIEEAIVLWNIGHWCAINLAKRQNIKDGRVWTYNAAPAFLELLHYLCPENQSVTEKSYPSDKDREIALTKENDRRVKKINRILKSLEDQGAVVCNTYNKRKADRTKWYSLTDQTKLSKYHEISPKALETLIGQNCPMRGSALDKNVRPLDKFVQALPDNKHSNNNKPAEAVLDLTDFFTIALNKLNKKYDGLSEDELDQVELIWMSFDPEKTNPTYQTAYNWIHEGLKQYWGTSRRSAKNGAARDKLSDAVTSQLEAQAAVIDQHTSNMKPKTFEEKRNDRSWADGLDL